ncbi:MAG: CCA tRNA nucleotidyltransferase [Thermoleophilia bacterium]|nr:CCA tRNA nucleotidyltransferase [Thermoleophilia bacterium]
MDEGALREVAGTPAYVVGGAVRDELLQRASVDIDIACRDPRSAAEGYAARMGAALFPLSERFGAWRVALRDGRTVDFTPLRDGVEDDLATRDFTVNAIARPLGSSEYVDPFGGFADLNAGRLRTVGEGVFRDDPLRLLRAVRLERELDFRLEPASEALVRRDAALVTQAAGERILAELARMDAVGFRRLGELGLLGPLGGSLARLETAAPAEHPDYLLVVVLGRRLLDLPVSRQTRRFARTLLRAERPDGGDARSLHRFRRATEPWALEALAYLGAPELTDAVRAARARDPGKPLLRGDELGVPQGPEVGRLLERIAEERAAGTVTTREEARELVAREAGKRPG